MESKEEEDRRLERDRGGKKEMKEKRKGKSISFTEVKTEKIMIIHHHQLFPMKI